MLQYKREKKGRSDHCKRGESPGDILLIPIVNHNPSLFTKKAAHAASFKKNSPKMPVLLIDAWQCQVGDRTRPFVFRYFLNELRPDIRLCILCLPVRSLQVQNW